MSIKFEQKHLSFAVLEEGAVEFNSFDNKPTPLSELKNIELGVVGRGKPHVPLDQRKGIESLFRYGMPVSVNQHTLWSIDLFMRSITKTSGARLSISNLIEAMIENSAINPDDLSTIDAGLGRSSDSVDLKRLSVYLRKFLIIEDEMNDHKLKEFYVPGLTFHDSRIIRILLLSLVSPELVKKNEELHLLAFLRMCGFGGKSELTIEHVEGAFISISKLSASRGNSDLIRKNVINKSINLQEIRDFAEDARKSMKLPNGTAVSWTNPDLNLDNYFRDILYFSFLSNEQLENIDNTINVLKKISNKFGTITYDRERNYPLNLDNNNE